MSLLFNMLPRLVITSLPRRKCLLISKITADGDCSHEIKTLTPWKRSYDQPRQHIKKQKHYFANKDPSSQGYGFSSSHVWMWELDYKESWALKNWCFWTVVLEKTLESPLDSKEIIPVNPKGNQPWIFIGRTDVGKDWEQEEKGATEDEMVGWHHWFNEHEFEQTPGDSDGQGSLACCSPWGHKELDMTELLNNWGMDKEDVVHTYNGLLLSHKKE